MELTLSEIFFCKRAFLEHHQYYDDTAIVDTDFLFYKQPIYFKSRVKNDYCCFRINENKVPETSYFIGIDWLNHAKDKAIYIQPKLNRDGADQVDYIKMLFSLLRHPDTFLHINEAYEIKWDDKPVEIDDYQDHLTPLLIIQYLIVLQRIVRKGVNSVDGTPSYR